MKNIKEILYLDIFFTTIVIASDIVRWFQIPMNVIDTISNI